MCELCSHHCVSAKLLVWDVGTHGKGDLRRTPYSPKRKEDCVLVRQRALLMIVDQLTSDGCNYFCSSVNSVSKHMDV